MITENKLDVRTITMGISLRDCAHPNIDKFCDNVYEKITHAAEFLVKTGEDIESEYGIPIIHKRVAVTPIAIAADACRTDSYVPVAEAMDRAAKEIGVNFIGGFSALWKRALPMATVYLSIRFRRLWQRRISYARRLISARRRRGLTWTVFVRWAKLSSARQSSRAIKKR